MYMYRPLLHNATNECGLLSTYTYVTALNPGTSTLVDVSTERVNDASNKHNNDNNVSISTVQNPQMHSWQFNYSFSLLTKVCKETDTEQRFTGRQQQPQWQSKQMNSYSALYISSLSLKRSAMARV